MPVKVKFACSLPSWCIAFSSSVQTSVNKVIGVHLISHLKVLWSPLQNALLFYSMRVGYSGRYDISESVFEGLPRCILLCYKCTVNPSWIHVSRESFGEMKLCLSSKIITRHSVPQTVHFPDGKCARIVLGGEKERER